MGYYVKAGLGIGMMLAGLGLLFVSILQLADIGTCASGGPFEVSQPCPEGIEKWVFAIFGAVLLFIAGIAVFAARGGREVEPGLPTAATSSGPDWGSFGDMTQAGERRPGGVFQNRDAAIKQATPAAPPVSTAPPAPTATPAPAPPPATTGGDSLERLEKLNELRAKGAISEAEFATAKARILAEL